MDRIKGFFACVLLLVLTVSCKTSGRVDSDDLSSLEAKALPSVVSAPKSSAYGKLFSPYFSGVDDKILLSISDGSPASIRSAVSSLYKPSGNYSEQEKVLFAMCSCIMKYAWPQERITWTVSSDLPDNLYTEALDSVAKGIFAFSSAENDVFMLTIPCLAMFTAGTVNGFYAQVLSSLEKALALNSDSVLNLYLAATAALKTKQYEKALVFSERAAAIEPNNQYIAPVYLESLLYAENAEKAYELSARYLTLSPQALDMLKLNARAAFASGRYKEAESLAAQVLQRRPDDGEFLLFRAQVLFRLEEYLSVSTLLDLYSRTDKTSKDYLLLRARLQAVWNKNLTAATASVQEALERYKDDPDVLLLAAEFAVLSGQPVASRSAFDLASAVLEKDTHNTRALAVLAKDGAKRRDWQSAYDAMSSLSQLERLSLENTLLYAQICLALNKVEQARTLLGAVYNPDTADENLRQWYIRLLIAEGKKNEASALINALLPQAAGKMKSVLYYEKSRLASTDSQILSDLRSSLTANPRNENALYDLYAYYYRQKDYRKAQYYLKQVIALNPSDAALLKLNSELDRLVR